MTIAAGRALVLLHAFPLSSVMWEGVQQPPADRWRRITPDLRGFGSAPLGADQPSVDRYAEDVVAELDRLGVERAVVGGVSLGGYVAMALLRRHADRVEAMVLADTKASADTSQAAQNRHRMADRVLAEDSVRMLADELVPRLVGTTTREQRPDVVARVTKIALSAEPAAVAWAQRAMAARPDSFDVLRATSVPALVLVGEEDELTPESDARAITEVMRGARLVILPAAGHLSPLEVPDEFGAAVGEFLGTL